MPNFTVREIAERIQRPGEKLEIVISRLKNWTKEGLIKPTGDRHPGTGRSRQYSEDAMHEAAMLQIIIDATGMPAVQAGGILSDERWLFKKPNGVNYLVISRSIGSPEWSIGWVKKSHLSVWAEKSSHDSHVVINLEKAFSRLGEK